MPLAVVSVVVVSWNTQSLLRVCVDSLARAYPGQRVEVIVVDNGSSDGSPEMIRSEHHEATLVETGSNLGYSKAINRGISICTADFVCLLNSDTELTPAALETMVDYLGSHADVGLVGPALVNSDGSRQSSVRVFPFWSRSVTRFGEPWIHREASDAPKPVDWLVGACLVLPLSVLKRVGGMDETYPFYGEDMDLAYRVHKLGLHVVQLPSARVIHAGEGSSVGPPNPRMRVRSYYEAPLQFLRKHGAPLEVVLWRVSRGAVAAARYVVARWLRRGPDADHQLAVWSSVVRLCVRGAPTDWSLESNG